VFDCSKLDLEFCFCTHRMFVKDIEDEINTIPNLDLILFHHSGNMEYLTWFELVSNDEEIYSLCEHLLVNFF
jgi:hypothetical protein